MQRALLLDLDGVLYQGAQPIPGAVEVLQWLAAAQVPHLFVTNTTSRPRRKIVEKLAAMGLAVAPAQVLTPIVAARQWITQRAAVPAALFFPAASWEDLRGVERLPEAAETGARAVLVGDLGAAWDFQTLNRAFRLLMAAPEAPLLALGMTRYWQAEDGLRLDTGPFIKALEYASGRDAVVLGKPAAAFFAQALAQLRVTAAAAVMVGDDILSDCKGAQDAGLRAIQVRTGKFRPGDLEKGIRPDWVLDSVARLPQWYAQHGVLKR